MATSVQDFLKNNPQYVGYANTANRTVAQAAQPKSRGGLAGFIGGIAKDIAHPFGYLLDASIGNPTRQIAAQLTNNKVAKANAKQRTRKNLGLGEGGDYLANAIKTWAGNSTQAGLTLLGPEAKSIKGAAAVGAGFGGSSAMAKQGSTSEDILTQALIGGALAGAGKGVSNTVGKLTGRGVASGSGKLADASQRLEGRSTGLGFGTKVNGKRVSATEAERLLKNAIDEGMPSGHPDIKYKWAGVKKDEIAKELQNAIAQNNRKLTPEESSGLISNIKNRLDSNIVLKNDKDSMKLARKWLKDIGQIDDIAGTNAQKKVISDLEKFAQTSQGATPKTQQLYKIFRSELGAIENKVEPIKAANKRYGDIITITEALGQEANSVGNLAKNASGGPLAILRTGDTAQSAKSELGRAGLKIGGSPAGNQGLSGALSNATSRFSGVPKMGLPAYPVSGSLAVRSAGQPAQQQTAEVLKDVGGVGTLSSDALYGAQAMAGDNQIMPNQQQNQQLDGTSQLKSSLQQAMLDDLQKTGGKRIAAIKSVYDVLVPKDTTTGPNTTKVTAQQYSLAQRGQQALQQMAQLLQDNPGVLNKTATPGRKLPIVGGFISNAAGTGDFDAIGYNVASSLLRLETGAQANESEIKNLQTQMIPRAGDSQQTIARKLQQLNQAFSVIIDAANNQSDSGLGSYIDQFQMQGGQ